jgi:hypothetical protein
MDLSNNWTLYYKSPKQNFVASVAADAEHTKFCEKVQDTTPRHYSMGCYPAYHNIGVRS